MGVGVEDHRGKGGGWDSLPATECQSDALGPGSD